MKNNRILLLGSMGAGKTTIGTLLASHFGWKYIDNDDELVEETGLSREELGKLPIPELHKFESAYLQGLLNRPSPFVAGAAGSVVDYESNFPVIESLFGIYLHIPLNTILSRVGESGVGRQIFSTDQENSISVAHAVLTERYHRRDPRYRSLSKITVELSDDPVGDVNNIVKLYQSLI